MTGIFRSIETLIDTIAFNTFWPQIKKITLCNKQHVEID